MEKPTPRYRYCAFCAINNRPKFATARVLLRKDDTWVSACDKHARHLSERGICVGGI